jgi:hypothetical protein
MPTLGGRLARVTDLESEERRAGSSIVDALFDQARPLLMRQEHQHESRPVEGGRWPISVVLFPDESMAASMEQLMDEVVQIAGGRHFHTGLAGSAHFTVRALEHYRDCVPPNDLLVERYRAAMNAAALRCGPIGFHVTGLTLTPGGVMACARPTDGAAAQFKNALASGLGPDGWREANFGRDIWYSMLLHFADDISDPQRLVNWVAQRRDLDIGIAHCDTVHLVRFRYTARGGRTLMRPEVLGEAQLVDRSSDSETAPQAT